MKREKNVEADTKMDPLMKVIKAVHSVTAEQSTHKQLLKQRKNTELFSKLVTPTIGVSVDKFDIDEIACEQITPSFPHRTDCIILYCHGGGYTCGELNYARVLAAKMAVHTGLEVFSFAYRLAPEHPFPAALEDAEAVWQFLMLKGYGSKQIILAGDSAGGNLALELCLNMVKRECFLPKGLILISPWTDMTATSPSYETYGASDPILSEEYVHLIRKSYVGEEVDYKNPIYSPLYADTKTFAEFPPTLIQVGSHEILRGDSERLAKKLRKAHCQVKLEIYRGGGHVFQQMPIHKATLALQSIHDFVVDVLG